MKPSTTDGSCCVPGCENPESRKFNHICRPHLLVETHKWKVVRGQLGGCEEPEVRRPRRWSEYELPDEEEEVEE